MKIDIKGILTGIKNAIFVKEEIENLAHQRLLICKDCVHYSLNVKASGKNIVRKDAFCMDCSCNIFLKTRDPAQSCPLGSKKSKFPDMIPKWLPITDPEKAKEIMATPELKKELDDYKLKLMRNQIEE